MTPDEPTLIRPSNHTPPLPKPILTVPPIPRDTTSQLPWKKLNVKRKLLYVYGETGTNKTEILYTFLRAVLAHNPYATFFTYQSHLSYPWDHYNDEPIIIFDDVLINHRATTRANMLDPYPAIVRKICQNTEMCAKKKREKAK